MCSIHIGVRTQLPKILKDQESLIHTPYNTLLVVLSLGCARLSFPFRFRFDSVVASCSSDRETVLDEALKGKGPQGSSSPGKLRRRSIASARTQRCIVDPRRRGGRYPPCHGFPAVMV